MTYKEPKTITPCTKFKYKDENSFNLTIEYWDFYYWEEYKNDTYYRVLWNNMDDSYYHVFVKTEIEARNIYDLLSKCTGYEEMFDTIELCKLYPF